MSTLKLSNNQIINEGDEYFVTYDLAVKLYELGFRFDTLRYYIYDSWDKSLRRPIDYENNFMDNPICYSCLEQLPWHGLQFSKDGLLKKDKPISAPLYCQVFESLRNEWGLFIEYRVFPNPAYSVRLFTYEIIDMNMALDVDSEKRERPQYTKYIPAELSIFEDGSEKGIEMDALNHALSLVEKRRKKD